MTAKAAEKQTADWGAVEKDYRAGVKSLRQIAQEQGISEGAIRKRAKRDEWSRDLAEKVRQKADELVRKDAVRNEVRTGEKSAEARTTERDIVEANAEVQAQIRRDHRRDIGRLRRLTNTLADELELSTEHREVFEEAINALYANDEVGSARALQKAMSLPGRITSLEQLSRTLTHLVKLEREAFGIDNDQKADESGYEAMLKRVVAKADAEAAGAGQ